MWPFTKKVKPDVQKQALVSVGDRGWTRIFDWTSGAYQSHYPLDREDSVATYPTVYACISRIGSDIGKLPPTIQGIDRASGVWETLSRPRFMEVLTSPNTYQTHIEFKENWIHSKLLHGNTYVLKLRDSTGQVTGLTILDPELVTPLVSEMGEVFYRLSPDNLSRISVETEVVPQSEVIHDRCNSLFHPLVGLSPIVANGIAAKQGMAIQKDSRSFFENGAKISGILTAPGPIDPDNAKRVKEYWESKFKGESSGSIAIVGDGLKYQAMRMNSVDAAVIQQLGWSDEKICSTFHVPPHMVGVGSLPTHDNIEALTQAYYSNCLQIHIEKIELLLARGLGIPDNNRIELDLERLFRTDAGRRIDQLSKGVNGAIMKPNEARKSLNLPPIEGGDTVYLQQQNYSLEALAKRDADEPFSTPAPVVPEGPDEDDVQGVVEEFRMMLLKYDAAQMTQGML
jgi:HK97 family phage portal protein